MESHNAGDITGSYRLRVLFLGESYASFIRIIIAVGVIRCCGDSICAFLVRFAIGKLIEQTRCCLCSLRVCEITRLFFLQGRRCLYRCYANVNSEQPHPPPPTPTARRLDQSEPQPNHTRFLSCILSSPLSAWRPRDWTD